MESVPCRIVERGGSWLHQAEQTKAEQQYTLTIPSTYTLTPPMRVVVGSDTYQVTDSNAGQSYRTATRATLMKLAIE